jgi:hypothetical protein
LLDQATDPPAGNTNEARLVAEAGAAEKKVLLELDEEKRKQAQAAEEEQALKTAKQKITDDLTLSLKKKQAADEKNKQNAEELTRKRKQLDDEEGLKAQTHLAAPPLNDTMVENIVMGMVTHASCEVVLREQASSQSRLLLRNTTDTVKKLTKDTVLLTFSKDTTLAGDSECDFKWEVQLKTVIVSKATGKPMSLLKYIKEHHQNTKEIYHYMPFPAGGIPKVLVKKADNNFKFLYTGPNKQHIYSVVAAVLTPGLCSLHWMVKFVPQKDRLEPCGLAVVLAKNVTVPGNGELILGP